MGLFSSIGNIFKSGAKAIGGILDPISSIMGSIGGISSAFGKDQSMDAVRAQIAGQQQTNIMNAEEALKTRAWQTWMSGTSHLREVADLRASGLNPILSATGGGGASTPSGATATMLNPYEGTAGAVNEARRINEIEKNRLKNEQQRVDNETELKDSTVELNKNASENQKMQAGYNWSNELKNAFEIERIDAEKQLISSKILTEMEQQNNLRAQALEKMSNVSLNSAYTKKTLNEASLRGYDLTEREFSHQIKKWTGPAREIFDTAGDAVDVIAPFSPKKYMRVQP